MAVREILIHPDERLRQVAEPVADPTSEEIARLVQDLADTMYDAPGVGLAATQIGVGLRVAVTDVRWRDEEVRHDPSREGGTRELQVWINPEFIWKSEETAVFEEGCLSVPEYYAEVERPAVVRLRWQDLEGVQHEAEFDGFLAVALQHEFDHLDGKLFIDYLSPLKRRIITQKLKKRYKKK